MSGWFCDAAQCSGVWPPQVSRASTFAPAFSSSLAASMLPVRATSCSAVSPSWLTALGLAPALSSSPDIRVLPVRAASLSGVAPNSLARLTSAPALQQALTRSASPCVHRPQQCSGAVVLACVDVGAPAACAGGHAGALQASAATSAQPARRAAVSAPRTIRPPRTARCCCRASPSGTPARLSSVSSRLACGVSCGYLQVLPALDLAVALAQDHVGQRIVVVQVAVAHVAAVQDDRMIQQRAVAILRGRQLLDELGEHLRVVVLDLHQALDLGSDRSP